MCSIDNAVMATCPHIFDWLRFRLHPELFPEDIEFIPEPEEEE